MALDHWDNRGDRALGTIRSRFRYFRGANAGCHFAAFVRSASRQAGSVGRIFLLVVAYGVRIARFPSADTPMSQWIDRISPESAYPTAAADFVASHIPPRSGRILNEFTWGGYLEWRLGPTYQTFLDGRTQLFSAAFWKSTYAATPETRTAYLSTIVADAAVLPKSGSILRESLQKLGWTTEYSDKTAEVLVPPAASAIHAAGGSKFSP